MILDRTAVLCVGSMMDCSYTVVHNDPILQDFHMISDGFCAHCFAECSIFIGFPHDLSWISRTPFCRMLNFLRFLYDLIWILDTLLRRVLQFSKVFK